MQTAWAQARQLALSAERPFLGLVLGTFAIWALAMLFVGRPVDLAAAAGRLGIALIGSLASFQFVDALLQIDDLLVTLFSQIGDGQVLQRTPLALIEAWDWGSEAESATDIGGGFVKGIWYGLFRAFLQLLLLLGMAAIAARLLIRLVWIWALTIVAPLVLVLSVLPPAQRLPVIWLKKLLRVVFRKSRPGPLAVRGVLGHFTATTGIAHRRPGDCRTLLRPGLSKLSARFTGRRRNPERQECRCRYRRPHCPDAICRAVAQPAPIARCDRAYLDQ